ncbi:Retrovirus-related Pol polyprotein from transposon 17.6 [Dictyocoela muelleri]|nr:Retrovirus-related Pol polyprotein from transposon 17.6 [Dictyocoela muelleri]
MNKIFENIESVLIYMDDILLFSKNICDHKSLLIKVFAKLHENNISVNFDKCIFAREEVQFLEHIVNEKEKTPIVSQFENYKDIIPSTKKQLQKIFGFINWFRPFIKDISLDTAALYEKLKGKGSKIVWEESYAEKLNIIFNKIRQIRLLNHPDLNKEFTLRCDASDVVIGSVLYQDCKILG